MSYRHPRIFEVFAHLRAQAAILFSRAGGALGDEQFYNAHKHRFNCYSYAVGDRHLPYGGRLSYPGQASGQPMLTRTADDLHRAILADGAIAADVDASGYPRPKASYRIIAAALSMVREGDFHFYRQQPNGLWTHKQPGAEVQHKDPAGQLITDPRYANRDHRQGENDKERFDYKIFVGFYYVPLAGLTVGKPLTAEEQKNLSNMQERAGYRGPRRFGLKRREAKAPSPPG